MWASFMDMHSGGGCKTDYEYIYIEAKSLRHAAEEFEDRFDRDPYNVTCGCCGEDYSIGEYKSLEQATAYQRNCAYDDKVRLYLEKQGRYGTYQTLEDYRKKKDVLIIPCRQDLRCTEETG